MWLAASVAAAIAGRVTPVNLRHALAAIPALAVLAAGGSAAGWHVRGRARLVIRTAVVAAWILMLRRALLTLVWA